MVCIYCGGKTQVTNSRKQKRSNSIWRRRKCQSCQAVFTSVETPDLSLSLVVVKQDGAIQPFLREKLFMSLLQSLKDYPKPYEVATQLTGTVINHLIDNHPRNSASSNEIIEISQVVLGRFDKKAHMRYLAEYGQADSLQIRARRSGKT